MDHHSKNIIFKYCFITDSERFIIEMALRRDSGCPITNTIYFNPSMDKFSNPL